MSNLVEDDLRPQRVKVYTNVVNKSCYRSNDISQSNASGSSSEQSITNKRDSNISGTN